LVKSFFAVVPFGHLASESAKAPKPSTGSSDVHARRDNSSGSDQSAYRDTAGFRTSMFQTLTASSSTSSASTSTVYGKTVTSVASYKKRSRAAYSGFQVHIS